MKVIKNINNNVSLCLDNSGKEVIVFGKGVGFIKPPNQIELYKIQRTFYDIDPRYLNSIAQIEISILDISAKIIEQAELILNVSYPTNLIITLADHIQFAVKRKKENINIKLPLYYDIKSLYPKETKIGKYALDIIKKELDVTLPLEEATGIAMHLINYNVNSTSSITDDSCSLVEKAVSIIQDIMHVTIDKTGFNYHRFATHMYYLIDRLDKQISENTENANMLKTLIEDYPEAYKCAIEIKKALNKELSKEELVYLIIHINRLCEREKY